tara:strand:- start:10380 stop:11405 length:1026 start_codon:yes stop_codon:yes gene_type:complete
VSPSVSIIVPARNEERALGRCLDSLLAQNYEDFELIVVDDQSTDHTPDLISTRTSQDSRIRNLRITNLPAGWTGKNHALACGAHNAHGKWLLFTDADTWHAPHSLKDNLTFAQYHHIDILSMSPDQECVSVSEKLLQPTIFSTLSYWFAYCHINDPQDEQAAGNGQYIMIRRSLYKTIGGHEKIKGCILEDVELARRAKRAGGTLWFAPAQGKVRVRMYHTLKEIWNGWAKNLYLLQKQSPQSLLRTSTHIILLDIAPTAILMLSTWYSIHTALLVTAGIMLIARWHNLCQQWRKLGFDTQYTTFYPIGSSLFLGLLWYSAILHKGGFRIVWKGRFCKELP